VLQPTLVVRGSSGPPASRDAGDPASRTRRAGGGAEGA
jgi:hypothetical protein